MAKKVSQSDPALAIEFWVSGFYTHRSQLFAPYKPIGVNVVSFHDPVIDGANMEDTDLLEWQRRPGFSVFCPQPLADGEIVNQFYSMRNLNGEVIAFEDSTLRLATFTDSAITTVIEKTTTEQGFISSIQNMVYFSDGAAADMMMWDSAEPFSAINPFVWGLTAPTQTPTIYNLGMWMPDTVFSSNQPVLDTNGNIEIAFINISGPTSQTQAYTIFQAIGIIGAYNYDRPGAWLEDNHPVPNQHYYQATTPTGTYSNYAAFTGFGFSIPANATILGVVANITKEAIADNPASSATDFSVKLLVANTPVGVDHKKAANWPQVQGVGEIGTGWGTVTYGSSTDTWGEALTPAIVNSPGFGVAIAAMAGTGDYDEVNVAPYPPTIQIYYQLAAGPTGSGQTGLNEPIWNTVINSPTQDGTVSWTNVGPIQSWFPVTDYQLPVVVLDTNGNLQIATTSTVPITEWNDAIAYAIGAEVTYGGSFWIAVTAGTNVPPSALYNVATVAGTATTTRPYWVMVPSPITTGPTAPTWSTVIGGQTPDGDYTWTNIGPGALIESFGTSYVYGFRTIYGHITTCSPISDSTGAILGPQNVGVTAFSITGNVVTFTGVNNFVPGSTFTVDGLDIGLYLNGQTFIVLAAGLSPTSFSATFTYPDTGSTPDTGQTTPLIAKVIGVGTSSPLCNAIVTITAISVMANIVRIYSTNLFAPGLYVTVTGVTTATWLNNLQLQIINVDPNGTWFEVYYQTPINTPQTADTGIATFNSVEIYRVSDGGGIYLFAGAVTNPGISSFWTYYDFTTDSDLNILAIAPQSHLNDPPPGAPGSTINTPIGTVTAYWQGRLWMAVGNFVYFDAGPDCVNGDPHSSWPPANRFEFVGPALNLVPTPDGVGLLVCLADRYNAILGGPETISFYPTDALSNFGISNPNAVFRDKSLIGQFTTQRQYIELSTGEQEIGEHIADYLSANFVAAGTYATLHRDGLDVGVFLSNGVDRVERFGSTIQAWSVPAFPINGAGALRSIETSVGVYSLMLASPNAGNSVTGQLTNPQSGASIGTGTAWANPGNITAGNPTDYATVTLSGGPAQTLAASDYPLNLPVGAVISGVEIDITGKTFYTGAYGMVGVEFDGKSGYVYTANTFNGGQAGGTSVEFWFLTDTTTGGFFVTAGPIQQASEEDTGLTFAIWMNPTGTIQTGFYGTPSNQFSTATPLAYNDNKLHQCVVTVDGGTGSTVIYIDGAAVSTTALTNAAYSLQYWRVAQGPIWLSGGWPTNISFFIDSFISHFSFWDAATLTSGQVAAHYAAQAVSQAHYETVVTADSPTSFWYMTETSGTTMTDSVDSDNGTYTFYVPYNSDGSNTVTSHPFGGPFIFQVTSTAQGISVGDTGLLLLVIDPAAHGGPPTSTTITSVTDSLGNHWTAVMPPFDFTGLGRTFLQQVWSAPMGTAVAPAGTFNITFTTSSTDSRILGANFVNFSGLQAFDQINTNSGTAVSWTTGAITIGQPEQLFSMTATASTFPYDLAGSPFAMGQQVANNLGASTALNCYTGTAQAAGAYNDEWANGSSLPFASALFSYKISATGFTLGVNGAPPPTITLSVKPLNPVAGATTHTFTLPNGANATRILGGNLDLWGMPWNVPTLLNNPAFGFGIFSAVSGGIPVEISISEAQVRIYYGGTYLLARDVNSWGDNGVFGENNGTPYSSCYITVGSITLSQPGAIMFPLQHVVGYFDAVGTLNDGAASVPTIWILPNEISDTKGVGFIELPEVRPEPPEGQTEPSASLLALRWPVNMMNSSRASQYIHHLQVKIQFEPENAPNTIKALAFKEDQI
jgi:hypothetical protein